MKSLLREAAIAAAFFLTGCGTDAVSLAEDVDPAMWRTSARLEWRNTDTASLRDMWLFLRCNERFEGDTLTLRLRLLTPDSLRWEESYRFVVPRERSVTALRREAAVVYRRRVRLRCAGDYRLEIAPTRPVRGVEAAGVKLAASHWEPSWGKTN